MATAETTATEPAYRQHVTDMSDDRLAAEWTRLTSDHAWIGGGSSVHVWMLALLAAEATERGIGPESLLVVRWLEQSADQDEAEQP